MIENINWYPGHMKKTRELIQENLKLVDLVIEVIDARIPISSRNPIIDELVKEKTAVKLTSGDHVKLRATDKNAQVLFIGSKALSEPVVWGGPIVMNTREELNKAFDDLNRGTFLQDKISY